MAPGAPRVIGWMVKIYMQSPFEYNNLHLLFEYMFWSTHAACLAVAESSHFREAGLPAALKLASSIKFLTAQFRSKRKAMPPRNLSVGGALDTSRRLSPLWRWMADGESHGMGRDEKRPKQELLMLDDAFTRMAAFFQSDRLDRQ